MYQGLWADSAPSRGEVGERRQFCRTRYATSHHIGSSVLLEMGGEGVSISKETKDRRIGATTKAGQYLEGSAPAAWTATKPMAPGLHWYRKSVGLKPSIVDVELHGETLRVDNKNTDQCRGEIRTIEGQWAGPLLPPK